ncbi:unhealthy ribosome biogenesis protein 2 homolog [Exaiptasia diaphana]|uniref:Nucleolar 27S pre-rRNA processing Urb2/Npa2 C-terminal domain-containing protein n=1 Tax=Exaiptasia diaphana TaxID=2652724 RepID=A0A913YCG7_EXADI|nr:unhealthy ribosome biogenesis protein 2 homolog [Exaiptasia diaphana]
MALQSIAHQPTNFDLKILSLELMTRILSLGPNMLYPHHSSLVFHGSLLVQLDHNSNRFPDLFCAQFSLLSTALFHHNEAVFKTMHVFMACVTNMLNSLCHYCSIKIVRKTKKRNQETQTKCADKMSRLYQEISSHKATISKYIPYMITEYIQQIQEHQLQEQVKKLLEAGIYCLIDASGEHEIALLHATLDRGSRELFTTLINEYNKFYKFKGKV